MAFSYRILNVGDAIGEKDRWQKVAGGFNFERHGASYQELVNLGNKRKFIHGVLPDGKGGTFEKIFALPTWEGFRQNADSIAGMCRAYADGAKARQCERLVKLAETVKVMSAVSMSRDQIKAAQKVAGFSDVEIDAAILAVASETATPEGDEDSE